MTGDAREQLSYIKHIGSGCQLLEDRGEWVHFIGGRPIKKMRRPDLHLRKSPYLYIGTINTLKYTKNSLSAKPTVQFGIHFRHYSETAKKVLYSLITFKNTQDLQITVYVVDTDYLICIYKNKLLSI